MYYTPGGFVNWECDSKVDAPPGHANVNGQPGNKEKLTGYNDWANVNYHFVNSDDYVDGVHVNNGNGKIVSRKFPGGKKPGRAAPDYNYIIRVLQGYQRSWKLKYYALGLPGLHFKNLFDISTVEDIRDRKHRSTAQKIIS